MQWLAKKEVLTLPVPEGTRLKRPPTFTLVGNRLINTSMYYFEIIVAEDATIERFSKTILPRVVLLSDETID